MSITTTLKQIFASTMLVGALALATPSDAYAQARPDPTPVKNTEAPATGKVSLQLKVVHATNSGKVDPELANVVDNLKFTRYTGFALLESYSARLSENQNQSFSVEGGRKVEVTLLSRDARAAKVRVVMSNQQGKVMDTTVSIHRNRAFMIAGPDHKGGKLVLPLTVSY